MGPQPHRALRLWSTILLLGVAALTASPAAAQQSSLPAASTPTVAAQAQVAPTLTPAAPQPKIDSGDTAWMLTSAALVLMMTAPGLALFYG